MVVVVVHLVAVLVLGLVEEVVRVGLPDARVGAQGLAGALLLALGMGLGLGSAEIGLALLEGFLAAVVLRVQQRPQVAHGQVHAILETLQAARHIAPARTCSAAVAAGDARGGPAVGRGRGRVVERELAGRGVGREGLGQLAQGIGREQFLGERVDRGLGRVGQGLQAGQLAAHVGEEEFLREEALPGRLLRHDRRDGLAALPAQLVQRADRRRLQQQAAFRRVRGVRSAAVAAAVAGRGQAGRGGRAPSRGVLLVQEDAGGVGGRLGRGEGQGRAQVGGRGRVQEVLGAAVVEEEAVALVLRGDLPRGQRLHERRNLRRRLLLGRPLLLGTARPGAGQQIVLAGRARRHGAGGDGLRIGPGHLREAAIGHRDLPAAPLLPAPGLPMPVAGQLRGGGLALALALAVGRALESLATVPR